MKQIIPSVEFVSPLSGDEVKMSLKELCGSRWDNYPFKGEVGKNSFRFVRNSLSTTKGMPKPILIGDFTEQQGGKTKVKISVKTSIAYIIEIFMVALLAIVAAGYGLVSTLGENFPLGIASAAIILIFGIGIIGVIYFLLWTDFQRSASKIKNALKCVSPKTDADH